jgi:hypothetical protein
VAAKYGESVYVFLSCLTLRRYLAPKSELIPELRDGHLSLRETQASTRGKIGVEQWTAIANCGDWIASIGMTR